MGDFWLQPLRTLSDLEDAKRAARHINDHSLAKMLTRKKKVRKSKKEAFQSVLLAARSCQESIPPKSVISRTSTEDQECSSSKPCQKRQIQLFVNSSLTSPVCLQLHPSTTISALKGLLQDKVGIEPEKQHLFTRKNHKLRDDLSLGNYGIEQDTNIELRLVSELMGGVDKQKTEGRKKTKRKQTKSTSTDKMSRQDNSNEEEQVRSPDESGHSRTFSTIEANASNQPAGRKRTRRRRQGKARRNPLLDEADRQSTSDDKKQDHSNDLGKSYISEEKPGKIPRRGKTKNKSGKRRKAQKVAKKSPSKEEAIDKTNKGDQAEDKLVNSRASTFSSAKTTAKRNNQSKGKIQSKCKTKKRSGKTRKGQKLAKKSPSEEEAIDKTNKGDEAEDKLVSSRDSTASSSAKTTAKRNNQSKGRKQTKKQTNADKKPSCEEKKESQIQLFVISSLRSPVCLQLHPSTTISALKGLLKDKLGIEPKKQHLYTRKNHELKGRMSLKRTWNSARHQHRAGLSVWVDGRS